VATPRLNKVVAALAEDRHVFAAFSAADPGVAVELSSVGYDSLLFETEHKPWDVLALRDSLQYLLNRRQIFTADSLTPAVTPLVRIPPNGGEMSQWHAKQALDLGAFGIVWPHVSRVTRASTRPDCAGTAQPRPPATGESPTPSTTEGPTCGRLIPTGRSSSGS